MSKPKKAVVRQFKKSSAIVPAVGKSLLRELTRLIRQTREATATAVNSALVLLYWQIGHRIQMEVLKEQRAEYGQQILSTLSKELVAEFGNGYSVPNLSRMMRVAEVYPRIEILSTLSKELGWSHFVEIISIDDDLKRDYYAEMCRVERWSVRTLRQKIGGMLFERTAISRKPIELARQELVKLRDHDKMTPDLVFRDPYFLDFLGLKDTFSEHDLEAAILRDLEKFILEFGDGFAFIDRQKRIVIDRKDFRIDLLFFNRKLRCLVAIDLKLGAFAAADKGQMELYLRWLEKYEMRADEERPIGLILCEDKGDEQVELLQLDKSGIRVARYLTELPSKAILRKKLKTAVEMARERLRRSM